MKAVLSESLGIRHLWNNSWIIQESDSGKCIGVENMGIKMHPAGERYYRGQKSSIFCTLKSNNLEDR